MGLYLSQEPFALRRELLAGRLFSHGVGLGSVCVLFAGQLVGVVLSSLSVSITAKTPSSTPLRMESSPDSMAGRAASRNSLPAQRTHPVLAAIMDTATPYRNGLCKNRV